MFINDLLFNRYTLGIAAVVYFAFPVIEFTNVIFTEVNDTLTSVNMLIGG